MWVEARRCCWATTVLGTGVACGCELLLCGLQTKLGCSERIASTLNNWTISPAKSKADLLLLFVLLLTVAKNETLKVKIWSQFKITAPVGTHWAVGIHGLCYSYRPCWSPSSLLPYGFSTFMLTTETMWKCMVHAASGRYGQGSFFCGGINDYKFIDWETLVASVTISLPRNKTKTKTRKQRNSPERNLLKKVLENCDKNVEE